VSLRLQQAYDAPESPSKTTFSRSPPFVHTRRRKSLERYYNYSLSQQPTHLAGLWTAQVPTCSWPKNTNPSVCAVVLASNSSSTISLKDASSQPCSCGCAVTLPTGAAVTASSATSQDSHASAVPDDGEGLCGPRTGPSAVAASKESLHPHSSSSGRKSQHYANTWMDPSDVPVCKKHADCEVLLWLG
jgi:hypothetical protein